MTSTHVREDLGIGIHAVYEWGGWVQKQTSSFGPAPNRSTRYPVFTVADHLTAIQTAWDCCYAIATYRRLLDRGEREYDKALARPTLEQLNELIRQMPEEVHGEIRNAQRQQQRRISWLDAEPDLLSKRELNDLGYEFPLLTLGYLRLGSPFGMDLLVEGAATGSSIAAILLLFRAMRDSKAVGGWIPRLLAGWREGMYEADEAKRKRLRQTPVVADFIEASESLTELELVEINIHGLEDPSPEIAQVIEEVLGEE